MSHRRGPDNHSISEALARIAASVRRTEDEEIPVVSACGRVLSRPAVSAVDLPPFASSAMDGYAVRASDIPGVLRVAGRVGAGSPSAAPLAPGETMAIATGAVVPDGADTVVPIELVDERDGVVTFDRAAVTGANVRGRGGDARAGDLVLEQGASVTPARIGALLAAGLTTVWCARRPRVVVVTTGTELRSPGEPLGPGQITETNGAMIAAALELCGAIVTVVGPVPDDADAHRAALLAGLEADLLVTSGGVSVGQLDLVKSLLAELGVTELLWGVAMRPGKPLWVGARRGTLVFGLPGNPVSALVGLALFVRPAVLMLQGAGEPGPDFARAITVAAIPRDPKRDVLVRATLRHDPGGPFVAPVPGQESHMIVRAAVADALVYVERGDGSIEPGSVVPVLRLD
jgi:molybdopterin molybdotransferase